MNVQAAASDPAGEPVPTAPEGWPQTIREFEALVEAIQDRLLHFAFYRLGDLQDAEDAVQEAFVRAYADREKLRKITWVAPYLFRMVGNRCTDLLRKRQRAGPLLEETSAAKLPGESALEQQRIEGLLGRLPQRQAEVLRLRVFADLQFDEIAEAVGRSVPTVKSQFRRGIERLRRILIREGFEI
jgi:RNA polymerase sigma-70 factor (ECF subfamily)